MKKTVGNHSKLRLRSLVILFVLGLVVYVVVPQIGSFKSSFHLLSKAHASWVLLGLAFYIGTNAAGALIYKILAPVRLKYGRNIIIQLAGSFANRLLPAGVGALGVSYRYLRRQKASESEALAVVTLNNVLGGIGNFVLLGAILVVKPDALKGLAHPHVHSGAIAVVCGVVAFVVLLIVVAFFVWRRLWQLIQHTLSQLAEYRRQPLKVLSALMVSLALTACFAGTLWASAQALGLDISYAQALIVMTVSVAVASLVPSPGGLGGAEAGVVAAMVAYHVPAAPALAAALLYRLLTYWLGLVLGAGAFAWIARRQYI